jgi:membrane fusion protein (multidrug efflux system)
VAENSQQENQTPQNGGAQGGDAHGNDNAQGQTAGGPDANGDKKNGNEPEVKKKRKVPPVFIVAGVALLILIAGLFYWHSTYYENTDDAEVEGHIDQISPRINGHVVAVAVQENQLVEAGQPLVLIDRSDYQVAVERAQANVASAFANWQAAIVNVPVVNTNTSNSTSAQEAQVQTARAQISQAEKQLDATQAQAQAAIANNQKAQSDLDRYTPLVEKDVISKQQYDQAVANAQSNKAAVNQYEAAVQAQREQIKVAYDQLAQAQANYRASLNGPQQVAIQQSRAAEAEAQYDQAKAELAQAQLNLSYTEIRAPYAGIVTKKSVEVGQNLTAGQAVMMLVSLNDLYVTADFKETQLRHIRAGQPVEIHVDAYGLNLSGRVTQIGGATGSLLSLFPPENATGNYVKVVQRLPVRIDFTNLAKEDPNHILRPGMSVEPKVRVKK